VTIIIAALLPVFVTLLLGYLAAWHNDYDGASSNVLNVASSWFGRVFVAREVSGHLCLL
jgi:predicted permease